MSCCNNTKSNQEGMLIVNKAREAAMCAEANCASSFTNATNAATSATNASNSAAAAAASETNVENIWEDFQERYMGPYPAPPVAPEEGSLYYNTTSNVLFVWNGSAWVSTDFNEFTNFTATGTTTARNLVTRFADIVNVKDFGAVGNGVTDDTAAIQAALNSGRGVYFPIGNYIVNSKITVTGKPLKIIGEHPVRSGLWFESASAGIEISFGVSNFDAVQIENIQLWKRGPSTTDAAIKINPPPAGVVVPVCTVNNISILGPWGYGVWLDGMSLTQFQNVIIDGNQSLTQACFRLTGEGFENIFNGCAAYSANTGFLIEGTHEGIYIDNCSIVNVIRGIVKTHSSGAEPWLSVRGTHINANEVCIRLNRTLQSVISNCLFYAGIGTSGPKTGWIGVDITGALNEDIIISNNIFNGLTYTSSKIGVSINVGDRIIVQSNHFLDTFTGINAPIGCINSKFQDNKYTLLTNDVVNVNTSNSHYWSDGEFFNIKNTANGLQIVGRGAGLSPAISAFGSDANLNINLATKGSGLLSFGTFQSQGDTATTGFITILDAGGTPRKLAVIP